MEDSVDLKSPSRRISQKVCDGQLIVQFLLVGIKLEQVDLDQVGPSLHLPKKGVRIVYVLDHVERVGGIETAWHDRIEVVDWRVE
jgi:hypothetical protein